MMKEIFHLQRFDLASKVECYSHQNSIDQLKVLIRICSDFERTILALEIEVAEGVRNYKKRKQSCNWQETEPN
jgi:hypothetical protein